MSSVRTVATIGGDGVGPDVVEAAIPAIDRAAHAAGLELRWHHLPFGADHYLATGETLPDESLTYLRDDVDAIFLGALGDPRVPNNEHARDILLGLRTQLDLFINFRPCTLLHAGLCPLKAPASTPDRDIDFVIFRENTEGSYLGRGSATDVGLPTEEQIVVEVHTAPKVSRILRAAFSWAQRHEKRLVTVSDKSNAIPGHRLWRRLAESIAVEFPAIELEFRYVDALAMELVRAPERFDVIVTSNLFGDILSDLGAQLVGGLGLTPSANLHPGRVGLFEPIHGSAPTLAGTGTANPMAAIATGGLMLAELGAPRGAQLLRDGIVAALTTEVTTPDLGGAETTRGVAGWIADFIRR